MDIANIANLPNPEAAILETKNIAIEKMANRETLNRIENSLRGIHGVKEVRFDPDLGIASVTFDNRETNFPEIHDTLLDSGYRPRRTLAE